eukprot:UN34140
MIVKHHPRSFGDEHVAVTLSSYDKPAVPGGQVVIPGQAGAVSVAVAARQKWVDPDELYAKRLGEIVKQRQAAAGIGPQTQETMYQKMVPKQQPQRKPQTKRQQPKRRPKRKLTVQEEAMMAVLRAKKRKKMEEHANMVRQRQEEEV